MIPALPDVSTDEIRDLIAKGWTPPPSVVEPFRHLLRPYYDAHGWKTLGTGSLGDNDCKTIAGLIATFDYFGIEIPKPRPKPVIVPKGTVVLR